MLVFTVRIVSQLSIHKLEDHLLSAFPQRKDCLCRGEKGPTFNIVLRKSYCGSSIRETLKVCEGRT